ncbi:unnamed protein product [Dovyalis caffra]|uniref:U2A'/phosphoprotein 32 family A C-terminal domain-containing protein n=1 Tax=Dovyalis caffra TaxID=77055 RepID=A0AAV1RK83_9ROSI|nr:unnamed protein product [Dovyalis caffra]
MVRLTADLIWKSPHFFNAIKERELDLRGNKIPVIENLGATEDQFDTIDLSDNEIVKLENMPYLNRLGTLIINNNRITRINPNIGEYLPKLHTLVLTNNRLVNLAEIDPLVSLPKLQFLSLLDNNITKKPNYRLYVIHKLKSLRVLDFKKVKVKERAEAEHLFASKEVEEEAKRESVKTFTPGEVPNVPEVADEQQAPQVVAPTPEQILAIKAAIVNSQTLEEVARLEKALNSGQLPADLKILDDTGSDSVKEQDDKIATDSQNEAEPDNSEEQKDNEATPMEQVDCILRAILETFYGAKDGGRESAGEEYLASKGVGGGRIFVETDNIKRVLVLRIAEENYRKRDEFLSAAMISAKACASSRDGHGLEVATFFLLSFFNLEKHSSSSINDKFGSPLLNASSADACSRAFPGCSLQSDSWNDVSELKRDDLKPLMSYIDESDGSPSWRQFMMELSTPNLAYQAWYRDPLVPTSSIVNFISFHSCHCNPVVCYQHNAQNFKAYFATNT